MHITYLIHQFFPEFQGGTEKFIYQLSSMMQKANQKVDVISYSFFNDGFYDGVFSNIYYKELIFKGIYTILLKHSRTPFLLNIMLEDEILKIFCLEIFSILKPDLVHIVHTMRMGEFINTIIGLKIPYILTATDFFLVCPKINLINSKGKLCRGPQNGENCFYDCPDIDNQLILKRLAQTKKYLENSNKIIFPSNFHYEIFKNEFDFIEKNSQTISHGINYPKYKKNIRKYVKNSKLVFGFCGTLTKIKGVHILISAFRQIKNKNIKLIIYGQKKDANYYNKLKELKDGDERIVFCGTYDFQNVNQVLDEIDVIVIPSICYESFSFILHESLINNIPVIASELGIMKEKIANDSYGFTFPPGNVGNLKKVMEDIVGDPTILNKINKNIKTLSISTIEEEAYQYINIYNNTIN